MIDEGYIKYQCHWTKQASVTPAEIVSLNRWRDRLYRLGLIGQYENGIGFGNLSSRINQTHDFIISGTQTGGIPQLTDQHYTKVVDFDPKQNYVTCIGAIKASSESLTHGALYKADTRINAVIHVHNLALWQRLINVVPTTHYSCAYGTPEMAEEIMRLCNTAKTQQQKIIVMSGHEEGIITFGEDIEEAGNTLLHFFDSLTTPKAVNN